MLIEDQINFSRYLACATVLTKQMKMKMEIVLEAMNSIITIKPLLQVLWDYVFF